MAAYAACHYDATMTSSTAPSSSHAAHLPPGARAPFGEHLRHWRQHRRLSQQGLALEAEISTRHLSYVETGRAQPSREMVLRLAERLSVPLRERNALLVAAGFAPMYQARPLDHPDLAAARQAVELVLKGHEPSPALAVDRHWNLVAANAVVPLLLDGVAPWLLEPPVNVLRLSLHPEGLGPRLANAGQWRTHLLHRLQQQISASADGELQALHDEIAAYPFAAHGAPATSAVASTVAGHIAVPFELHTELGTLSFISTITIFGTPVDVTLQELAVESFFPANTETQQALRRLQARRTA